MVVPRVSFSEVKYILPKRRFCRRSAFACADFVHCRVISTWQPAQVVEAWGFTLVRRSGGGVYADATRARTRRTVRSRNGVTRGWIKVRSWYPAAGSRVKQVGEDRDEDLRPRPDRSDHGA